ncbi:TPA: hypothetical protein QDC22_007533 [Burkholderia stabilis]|nr:hypothetical protein [Burkholderia stabilis]HDR9589144.1 hypothetical protein [Burkholderia stabilis]HDR9649540.1 hypothetical protein [Burkholderia stabilis]HDR9653606.1 hypothetical protein [Burkholderia stabilis]HDR9656301.1 hypothetical protein [Burkholderia stabilis]
MWPLEMLRRLLLGKRAPQQPHPTISGHGNVQADSVGRDLTNNVMIIQALHIVPPAHSDAPQSDVPAEKPSSMPASAPRLAPLQKTVVDVVHRSATPTGDPAGGTPADAEVATLRRELFDLLEKFDRTPDRRTLVLHWMEQQFGTKRVVDLDRNQLFRTVRWASVVLKDRRKRRAARGTVIR